jgi:hypothetical protein
MGAVNTQMGKRQKNPEPCGFLLQIYHKQWVI